MGKLFNKLRAVKGQSASSRLSFGAMREDSSHIQMSDKNDEALKGSEIRGYFSRALTAIGMAGLLYSGVLLFDKPAIEPVSSFSIPAASSSPQSTNAQSGPPVLAKSEPLQVRVPSVGIDAKVETVGRKDDGTMETPPLDQSIAGWYKLGPTPGELGPSIIVGHVDTYEGPAIFYRLKDIKPKEIIEVSRADGSLVKFEVTELQQFEQNNFPTDKVYGNIDHAGIRLITCGGVFNKDTQRYSHNTVVFGKMIAS